MLLVLLLAVASSTCAALSTVFKHRAAQRASAPADAVPESPAATHERLAILRRELNGLVAAWNHRTGQAHGITHHRLRKELGGPPAAIASEKQLADRIDKLREWAAG